MYLSVPCREGCLEFCPELKYVSNLTIDDYSVGVYGAEISVGKVDIVLPLLLDSCSATRFYCGEVSSLYSKPCIIASLNEDNFIYVLEYIIIRSILEIF